MFRLEKVFQNEDKVYIYFVLILKVSVINFTTYFYSITENNSIFDFKNYKIFESSNYFLYCILISLIFFLTTTIRRDNFQYQKKFKKYIFDDLIDLLISNIIIFLILYLFDLFLLGREFLILNILIFIMFILTNYFFDLVYSFLIEKNIIQKNIMLVGEYDEIKKILNDNLHNIYVIKCCMMNEVKDEELKLIKSEIKLPIFNVSEDIRTILEYHSLGQIWILNANKENKKNIYNKLIKFSVDTLNIKLDKSKNNKEKTYLSNKYEYEYFEKSKFYGINLLIKIILDKILSIIFLILFSPIIFVAMLIIYLEDGLPIFFIQNRTGWDGRRFKIIKLRSLKKTKFDKKQQVVKDDNRLLKSGKFLRRWGIDELPQLINIINGDMSLVGPKPHMVEHDIDYSSNLSDFLKRYKCNPGLTGWAQVNGLRGSAINHLTIKKRMEYDLWYLKNWSLWLDFYIIFKTIFALIKYKGEEN